MIAVCLFETMQVMAINKELILLRDIESVALCSVMQPEDKALPEKIQILPAGVVIRGEDGRVFVNQNATGVVSLFKSSGRDIVLDWEHETVCGWERAPAAGWIHDVELDADGAMWAMVKYTPDGAKSVANKEYRYVSPAFYIDENLNITGLQSVGLTNRPNLKMQSINKIDRKGQKKMELILKHLELDASATEEQAIVAINKLKNKDVDLEKFVPASDFELAVNRAKEAEAELKKIRDTQKSEQINAAVDEALKAGKIAPSSVDFFTQVCSQENGLDKFKKYVDSIDPILKPGVDSHFENAKLDASKTLEKNDIKSEICKVLNIDRAKFDAVEA